MSLNGVKEDIMEIRKVGVVGCGLMGSGIVQVSAASGFEVVVREINEEFLGKGLGKIEKQLGRAVAKGRMDAQTQASILGRITGTTSLEELSSCDLIVEAVTESVQLKQELWATLDQCCPKHTIFSSNTSSIPIAIQAKATARPDRFIGLHFFNPVPVMKLVEVIRPEATSDETYEASMEYIRKLKKDPVTCSDSVGFIVNRLLIPFLLDAVRALEAGIATAEDIDTGMKLGCNHPMGPLTLLDFVGLDTTVSIAEIMYAEFKLPQYEAPALLKKLVAAGKLGRKTGAGIYQY
jgi:3-hydroxybutyryl-CoA dehydrogenase